MWNRLLIRHANRAVGYLTLLTGLLPVLWSCNSTIASNDKELPVDSALSGTSMTTVSVATAVYTDFPYFIHTNGKIKSLNEQIITAERGGRLTQYHARAGVVFPAGSVIAQVETTAIQHRLERAQLTKYNSEKEYESLLLGYENLLKERTAAEAEAIRQKLRISSGLAGAEQEIKEAMFEMGKTVIRAPFTGVLSDLKCQPGEVLQPGQQLFRIYDAHNLLLEVMVLEADVILLKKGTPASVSPVSAPDMRYTADVYEINPYVDENGMVEVKLKLRNPESRTGTAIFPGMNCSATVEVPMHKAVLVPKEAVIMRSGKSVVFTYDSGRAKWNYVITGRDNGKDIEILDGIKSGMKVITTNNLQLAHDAPVQLAN